MYDTFNVHISHDISILISSNFRVSKVDWDIPVPHQMYWIVIVVEASFTMGLTEKTYMWLHVQIHPRRFATRVLTFNLYQQTLCPPGSSVGKIANHCSLNSSAQMTDMSRRGSSFCTLFCRFFKRFHRSWILRCVTPKLWKLERNDPHRTIGCSPSIWI